MGSKAIGSPPDAHRYHAMPSCMEDSPNLDKTSRLSDAVPPFSFVIKRAQCNVETAATLGRGCVHHANFDARHSGLVSTAMMIGFNLRSRFELSRPQLLGESHVADESYCFL